MTYMKTKIRHTTSNFPAVSTVLVADMAPETMRGRYMGAFSLTWGLGYGLGPTLGGAIMDNLGGRYVRYTSLILGSMAAVAFLLLGRFVLSPVAAGKGTGLAEPKVAGKFVSE